MNARAIKKHLMGGRASTFFGRRAYISVRLPVSLLGTQPPQFTPEGFKEGTFKGEWENEDESVAVIITKVHSGRDPAEGKYSTHERPLFIEDDGYGGWSFWSGYFARRVDDKMVYEPVPDEWVAQHRTYSEWADSLHCYGNHPLLDAFLSAGESAKTTDFQLTNKWLDIVFGVKWFYPGRKLRFCRDLSGAIRLARKENISVRLLRGLR
jgi:hypothetical protein